MLVCQFLVAIIGVTIGFNKTHLDAAGATVANNIPAVNAQIAFIAIYIFFFASTWGPGAWVVIGESCPSYSYSYISISVPPPISLHVLFACLPEAYFHLHTQARSSRSLSVPVVSVCRRPPTGCGTPSSPSSPRTWSTPMQATSARPSSSFGFVFHSSVPCFDRLMDAFPTGLPLHMCLCLRLFPHTRDQGSHTRANRPDARGDDPTHVGRLGTEAYILGRVCQGKGRAGGTRERVIVTVRRDRHHVLCGGPGGRTTHETHQHN